MSERLSVGQWQKVQGKVLFLTAMQRETSAFRAYFASLIIWVRPNLSSRLFPYQSLFYVHFIKAASGQTSNTKPLQRQQFDFLHRSKPNGRVLFSCLKQSAVILLPWRHIAEVNSFVSLSDQMPVEKENLPVAHFKITTNYIAQDVFTLLITFFFKPQLELNIYVTVTNRDTQC